jgi:type 1 glutamine amidotransferase
MDANGLVTQTIELDNSESVSVCGAKTLLEKLVANVKDELKSETFAEQYTTKSINALRTALINAQNLSDTESTEKITEVYQSLLTASEVGENGLVKADRNVVVAFGNAGVQRGFSAGSGWYANGDKVTLKITPSVGYVFSNWTSDTDRKNVVGKSLEYTFTLQSDSVATYYAWLTEKNYTVSLTSTEGGVASTNSANGQYTYKEEATVTAKENNDYMFVGWKDRYGNTVSVQNPYEFKVLGNTTLTPEFVKTKDDNGKEITYVTVNFYHQSGNLLSSQKVAIGTSKVKAPIDPTKVGFVFKGWSTKHSGATQEDVLALDTTAFEKDTNLYPVFVVQEGKTYTVTVDNELVKTYKPHSVVTLTAEDISGKKFVGWKNSSGNYVSYESNYSFIITGNVVLSKEYVSADSEITKVPTITMEQPIYEDVSDNVYKMTFYFNYDLPEDYQLVDVGVLKLYNQSKEELSLDTSGVVQTSVLSKLGSDGQFYYSKLNYSTDSHTVCGYLIYEDASGVRYTIYSNAIYGSKN